MLKPPAVAAHDTLLLSQGYRPIKVIPWQRAICMNFLGKVEVVRHHSDREIRSVSVALPAPAVVRLLGPHRSGPVVIRFSRRNVYLRDRYTCQYCRTNFHARDLTLDHVVPRAQGGRTHWENVVTSCSTCNRHKGNRTPEAARMPLARRPVRPGWLPSAAQLGLESVPEPWRDWMR